MSREKRAAAAWIAALVLAPLLGMAGGSLLPAQPQPPAQRPMYQYVGVDQTIARIETTTGRVEILARPGETRASLLIPDRRPWQWRDVPIDEKRPRMRGVGPRGDHEDDAGGSRGERHDESGEE